jgi:iron complex outermembrane receptor protein
MTPRLHLKPLTLLVLQALACHAYAAGPDDIAPDAAAPVGPVQVVEVLGQGQSRQVQNVSRNDLVKLLPGASPLKALEKLPGVSFQSADPFGAYEWSTRISIRGFNQGQLGFTLDGIPLGDMSYGNSNGLHISRAISSENVGSVSVSQGAGVLGTASTSNLGGTVQFFTLAPSDTAGATLAQTVGSDSTSRTFARYDTGVFGNGSKLFLSGTRQRADKWKGAGPQNQDQFNSRFETEIGATTLSGFFNYSKRDETDYQDLSPEMVKRLGYNWDNYQPDWQRAINAAKGVYTGGVTNMDDAYYLGRGLRNDSLAGLSLDFKLAPAVAVKATAYHHENQGQGHWYTPYTPSSATVPISIRTTEYSIARDGFIADLSWDFGAHTVNAGFWNERSKHILTRNYYAVTGPDGSDHFLTGPFKTDFKQAFTTTTNQFYLQDVIAFSPELKMNIGFKSPKVTIDAANLAPGSRAAGTITAKKAFLPQLGLNYALSREAEIFASAAQNMRAYQPGVTGPFSQTQAAFDTSKNTIKPETSVTVDLGMRYKIEQLQASVAVYHADFSDRLLSVATCAGIVGCPSTFVNVGKVATSGIEAVAQYKFTRELSWFNSFTHNESKYKSDYFDNNKLVAASGKDVVDAPRVMFDTELAYENADWFTRLGAKYTDKRYYTYLNDNSVPAYTVATLTSGVKFKSVGSFKDVTLQLTISNLTDKKYLGTIGSNGFVNSDPTGQFATMLTGAPRQVFLTLTGKL